MMKESDLNLNLGSIGNDDDNDNSPRTPRDQITASPEQPPDVRTEYREAFERRAEQRRTGTQPGFFGNGRPLIFSTEDSCAGSAKSFTNP